MYKNKAVTQWVEEMAKLTKPDKIVWLDGSDEERIRLTQEAVSTGEIKYLNQEKYPGCLFHRTAKNDVARVEHLTFICSRNKEDAGPTNNWMAPEEAYEKAGRIFDGSMRGRTMYVIPYIMGPMGSPFSKVGIELTDSIYVVLNMRIMTTMGKAAMEQLGDSGSFVKGLHSKADLNPERRYIMHFPEDNTIWSVGSGYGGNVLLGKKCFSLRIASNMARHEGWLAEHMLILGVENPQGKVSYVAAAFPSACGKTNLAMLVPPPALKGYKTWTVGDDIAWMRIGEDGRLWAMNPETGFFGVVPGTSSKTNPNALIAASKNTIYTNVLEGPDGTIWWEGLDQEPPAYGIDWKGDPWTPDSGTVGAHPNSRFTAPASQCPSISPEWRNPEGVPITALIFGGRRAKVAPLVYQSFDWQHGVFVGATIASETTAADTGEVGVVRRDPMAMLPFCGYHMGDYWRHWLEMGKRIPCPPKIFHVNWFRTNKQGKFLWPGFGENLRVLNWIISRCEGESEAVKTPIGYIPTVDALNLEGLDLPAGTIESLLSVDREVWKEELNGQLPFLEKIGDKLPKEIMDEHNAVLNRLN
ncbi:phosphoenolpyruvate carboxykinase (GTP) [Pelotomaculum isophthalicicum JI]|uniref:Phosphoenolpyruvate carboxykinase [GTP] n=1 Tax=Pelotomaculum isophthalicicum JI TaxID=947010 RepID=A0A9X4JUH4_9FIRM|nr:phosphoenolpyruvate carboxykinase (GTP) [Pelotomaculum isophthalicicum]MDF9409265.1 phosphoenolpyruvate carboxykinase (GTP) [Pelotomaculum isophthalicicum JI]